MKKKKKKKNLKVTLSDDAIISIVEIFLMR
jgi:hypothetical protein